MIKLTQCLLLSMALLIGHIGPGHAGDHQASGSSSTTVTAFGQAHELGKSVAIHQAEDDMCAGGVGVRDLGADHGVCAVGCCPPPKTASMGMPVLIWAEKLAFATAPFRAMPVVLETRPPRTGRA